MQNARGSDPGHYYHPATGIMAADRETALAKVAERQTKPQHYQAGSIQPWDFIIDQGMGFLDGNVVKYLCRYRKKNGLEDLLKAREYLAKLIASEQALLSK